MTFTCSQKLGVAHCRQLTDRTLVRLADALWIEELNISYCSKLTDEGLLCVIDASAGLQELNIAWCRKMTNAVVDRCGLLCKQLKKINISECENISDMAIERLRKSLPTVEVVEEHSEFARELKAKILSQTKRDKRGAVWAGKAIELGFRKGKK